VVGAGGEGTKLGSGVVGTDGVMVEIVGGFTVITVVWLLMSTIND
jgi:hypothetical protein